MPYLISLVLAANIGSTATMIGDPPNIIIAGRAGLTFNDFLSTPCQSSPGSWPASSS